MNDEIKQYTFLSSELDCVYHDFSKLLGVSDTVLIILYTLFDYGDGCKQSEIYRLSGLTRQTVNSALQKMENENLILLKNGSGRNVCVFLTDSGRNLMNSVVIPIKQCEEFAFYSWTQNERSEYLRLTKKFIDGMKQKYLELKESLKNNQTLSNVPPVS